MKFVILMIFAAAAGALSVLIIPTTIVSSGIKEVRETHLADLNPLRLIFDYEQRQIQTPMTPDELGFHTSRVTLTPLPSPAPLKLDLGQSFQSQAALELQQNDRRMQDMQAYMQDPGHWVGPPPN